MRPVRLLLLFCLALPATSPGVAQEPKADSKAAPSKVVGVTVYQNTALVTREVTAPDAVGTVEVTVTPLPASTMSTSLYAEGADGVRVFLVTGEAVGGCIAGRIRLELGHVESDLFGVLLQIAWVEGWLF